MIQSHEPQKCTRIIVVITVNDTLVRLSVDNVCRSQDVEMSVFHHIHRDCPIYAFVRFVAFKLMHFTKS